MAYPSHRASLFHRLPEKCAASADAAELIKQYISRQPRTPQNPDVKAINEIMHIPGVVHKYYQNTLTDDFYVCLIEVMCDPDVSDEVRLKLASWDWPHAPAHILKAVMEEIRKFDPSLAEYKFLKNQNKKENILGKLEKRYQEEANAT